MNQTTIYIGIGVLVLIVIIVGVIMSRKKTETVVKEGCNLGYDSVNGECKFIGCPSGFYNDINEKKCKKRTKVCSAERTCENVTENPNADECIKDISRCACEFGKYKNSDGVCTPYSDSVMREYNENKDNPCKNVSLDPNADRVIISNKPDGTVCRTDGAYEYSCVNGECSNKKCAQNYYDKGDGTCIGDCKDNDIDEKNNINDTVNRRCVASCPSNTYYNKIVNDEQVVKNECVRDCRNIRQQNIFGVNVPLYNFSSGNKKYCISCLQDISITKTSEHADKSADKYVDVYTPNLTVDEVTISRDSIGSNLYINFVNENCVRRN
jgi:hypothetical protein